METPFMHAKNQQTSETKKRKEPNVVLDAQQTVSCVHP